MPPAVANRGSRPSAGAALAARSQGTTTPPPQQASAQGAAAFDEKAHPRAQSGATGGQFVRKGQGMTGQPDESVKEVQRGINAAPNAQRVVVDGRFGPVTEEAVRAFQRTNGLNANGIVDPATRETMLNAPPLTAAQANAEVQATLHPARKSGGRASGGSSGSRRGGAGSGGSSSARAGSAASLDPSDVHSIEEFQRAHGLKVDGIIGPDTQAMLRRSKDFAKTYGSGSKAKAKANTKLSPNEKLRLTELGFEPDGSGLKKLQQKYGLDPSGVLDDATRKLLHRKGSRLEAEQKGIARGKAPKDGIKLAEGLARAATTHVLQEAPFRPAQHPRDRNGKWIKGAIVTVPSTTAARSIKSKSIASRAIERGTVVEDKGDTITVSVGGRKRDVPSGKVRDIKGGDGMPPPGQWTTFYHGTSKESASNLIKNGPSQDRIFMATHDREQAFGSDHDEQVVEVHSRAENPLRVTVPPLGPNDSVQMAEHVRALRQAMKDKGLSLSAEEFAAARAQGGVEAAYVKKLRAAGHDALHVDFPKRSGDEAERWLMALDPKAAKVIESGDDAPAIGQTWQVNGRGEQGGFYTITQLHGKQAMIRSERSGREQSIETPDLLQHFTRGKNGNTLHEAAEFKETTMTLAEGLARAADTHPERMQEAGPPAAKCAMDHKKMAKGKDKCPGCEADLKALQEAGTKPEPFSKSKTSNWVARAGGLPTYIQHVAHDIIESGSITDESHAIATAVSQAKKNAAKGNKQAAEAVRQWEAMKARNKAKGSVQEAEVVVVGAMVALMEATERLSAADSSSEVVRARAAQGVARGRLEEALGLADAESATSSADPEAVDIDTGGEVAPARSWAEAIDSLNPGSMLRIDDYAVTRLADGDGFTVEDIDGGLAKKAASAGEAVSLMNADEDAEERRFDEALFTEQLHPRDRLGKFMGALHTVGDKRGGRALATSGLPIPVRDGSGGPSLPAGKTVPTHVKTPSSQGDNGNPGTPRGTSSGVTSGARTPTRGGTSGESSGTKPAWDTDANYQAYVKENLHAGHKAEQLTREHFQATMVRHHQFLADRKARMSADAKSGEHGRHADEDAARRTAAQSAADRYDWSDPANKYDESPNEKATVSYRTPFGEVRKGTLLGSPNGRDFYLRDSETQGKVSVPGSRLTRSTPSIPTTEPQGFHDRVAGLDAGGVVSLPGGTRVRRLIPTHRSPYPTWEVASGGKRVTRRNAAQASRIALRFDGSNPKEAGTGA